MKFKELKLYQTFDWINDKSIGFNSFFERCQKTTHRTYVSRSGWKHRVGSINAKVYHEGKIEEPWK